MLKIDCMHGTHSPLLPLGIAETELAFIFRTLSALGVREEEVSVYMELQSLFLGSFCEPGKALHTPQAQGFCVSSVGGLQRSGGEKDHNTFKILTIEVALASQQCFYLQREET